MFIPCLVDFLVIDPFDLNVVDCLLGPIPSRWVQRG